jgi:hypothetical protein
MMVFIVKKRLWFKVKVFSQQRRIVPGLLIFVQFNYI